MSEKPRVGFIGLGLMGKPMTRNLLQVGCTVTVHNRSRGAVEELAAEGARRAFSPGEVAQASQFVFTSLPGPVEVEEVYLGPGGIVSGAQSGSVFVEMSTVGPDTHKRIAAAAAERKADYLDAPVSGGPSGAQSGTLTIMVGGETAVLERSRPLLEVLGERIYHIGPLGSGAIIKLVNNMLLAINTLGVIEGMVLGTKAGLDPAMLNEVIGNSSGTSRMFTYGVPSILKRDFEPGFMVDSLHKDVALAVDLARALGVRLLAGSLAVQVLEEARGNGLGRKSIFAPILPLERITGIEVKAP